MTQNPFLSLIKPWHCTCRVGLRLAVYTLMLVFVWTSDAASQARIKDIVDFEGVRENLLVGYGLVVGLNGTGDSLSSAVFTKESLIGMLERLGVNARDNNLKTNNVAAVMVTATLPPLRAKEAGSTSAFRRWATPRTCSAEHCW